MFTTERIYDGNDTTKEYNNRIYSGAIGYRWVVYEDGNLIDTDIFKTFKQVKNKFPTVVKLKHAHVKP